MAYSSRIADTELANKLGYAGAVLIEGPRACGKTETARRVARSAVLFDTEPSSVEMLSIDPNAVLDGDTPRLIDEWQIEPAVWNHVRRAVDERGLPGQFILTGSAEPRDDATRHTGAGRFARLRMRPMSSFERGASNGQVSLAGLLAGEPASAGERKRSVALIAEEIARGGWPGSMRITEIGDALEFVRDYLAQTVRLDVAQSHGIRHDPRRVGSLIASLARNTACEASVTTLAVDAGGNEGPLSRDTVANYLDALARVFVLEDQPAWAPHLRSRAILRNAPKRHLADPSLAVAALRASPELLIADLNLLGMLFESLVVRDLRVYSQPLGGEIFHYRDNVGLEVDAIVQTADRGWGAVEVKLSPARIEEAASSLRRFASKIDTEKLGEPRFLAVVTGVGYAFRRPDGIDVVPYSALGP